MFFIKRICQKYGHHEGAISRKLLKTAIKTAKLKNRLKFLLNCRRCKLIPKCLDYRVKIVVDNDSTLRELKRLEYRQKLRLISVIIADTKRSMAKQKKCKEYLSEQVTTIVDADDWPRIQRCVEKKARAMFTKVKVSEIKKLDHLKKKKIARVNQQSEWIENTTQLVLPDFAERALMLGPNFNLQNVHTTPYVRFVAEVENAIAPKKEADTIRAEIATAVTNHANYLHQPRSGDLDWVRKDVLLSKRFFKQHEDDVCVLRADKGNKTVILSKTEYTTKMTTLLGDTTTYKRIKGDPTAKVMTNLNAIADEWWENQHIDAYTRDNLKSYHCYPPRIYGLPKVHKPDRPLRPVVSTVGSVTYKMAQYLSRLFKNVVGNTERHIKSSFDFADEVSKLEVPEGQVMYSLDVTSLYTNIPTDKVYECILNNWHKIRKFTTIPCGNLQKAVKAVLGASFFKYNGVFYEQTFGLPMGSPIAPCASDLVLEELEEKCIAELKTRNVHLTIFKRYVDDCFVIGYEEDIQIVLDVFNSALPTIKFTLEKESESSIRFLDLTLTREGNKIKKVWYPKQVNGRYLDFNSESPFEHKKNTAISLIDRAIKLTDVERRAECIDVAKNTLRVNNFPESVIKSTLESRVHKLYNTLDKTSRERKEKLVSLPYIPSLSEKVTKILGKYGVATAHRPCDKLKTTLFSKMKDPISKMQQIGVVYSIPCEPECKKEYVGQTAQTLQKRLIQHKSAAKRGESSTGLSQHATSTKHAFDLSNPRILDRISNKRTRLIAETLHIKTRQQQVVNLQTDSLAISNAYDNLTKTLGRMAKTDPRVRENRTPENTAPS